MRGSFRVAVNKNPAFFVPFDMNILCPRWFIPLRCNSFRPESSGRDRYEAVFHPEERICGGISGGELKKLRS